MKAFPCSEVGRLAGLLTRHRRRVTHQVLALVVAGIALTLPTAAQSPPVSAVPGAVKTGDPAPSVAFFYGANPPLDELKAFEVVVVEPDHLPDPRPHRREARDGASELYAYVSFGEVLPSRAWYKQIPPGVLKGENREWGSSVVDHSAPGWREFFVEKVMAPLWERGYRGFFFDTMDSYHLIARTDAARAVQEAAMVETFGALRARFPGLKLFLNRGFEILPRVRDMVSIIGAESLYRGWDQGKRVYREVPAADRDWLLGQLNTARNVHGLTVVGIDYVPPAERALARDTARRIRALGFVPWVANPELDALGVGSREVVPRRVLVLTDRPEDGGDLHYSGAQRLLGMPLNYLGYAYELIDPRSQALPEGVLAGRYAGIVTWLSPGRGLPEARVAAFLKRHMADGVRVAVFNQFPFALEPKGLRELGIEPVATVPAGRLAVARRDAMLGFETEVLPRRDLPLLRVGSAAQSLLRLTDTAGNAYDPVAVTPWGGYALAPYAWSPVLDLERWVVDPVRFLRAALATPDLPVPDVTTESGRRMLMVHVDGDGWASRAEMAGIAYASEIMEKEVLARYRVPTTVSVIQGETAADGLYSAQASALEAIARRIFRLPHVEPASHSYSHPFNWAVAEAGTGTPTGAAYHLKIAGYRFDLRREIAGSIDYIGKSLAPPEKPPRVFLWTGNCVPTPAALRTAAAAGLLNMNGGDTTITRSHPTWTRIAPQGIRKEGLYQVFAPNQNENVYTNDWTGPFYGYER
ncbi:MAG: bifunctional glycoside hydrolase 114/ polysaccharide deacetylase family protein, partial [Burkholderiales bacterium]|nr:bifunctional glycoside hydrolase 114/ polysaccharide deacetylase family protein [Burkholderiales bacterium]